MNEKVIKVFYGCELFFSIVLDGYVVYVIMEYFGMVFLDDSFFKNLLRRGLDGSFLFFEKVGEMVDKFVFFVV